jgi:hypothetical protein
MFPNEGFLGNRGGLFESLIFSDVVNIDHRSGSDAPYDGPSQLCTWLLSVMRSLTSAHASLSGTEPRKCNRATISNKPNPLKNVLPAKQKTYVSRLNCSSLVPSETT